MNSGSSVGFLPAWYHKLASGKIAIMFALVYAVSQAVVTSMVSPLGNDVIILQTTFSQTVFSGILEKWGESGLQLYRSHFCLDFFHPLIYAIFLSSVIAWLTSKDHEEPGAWHLVLFSLPYVAALCDLIENTLHLALTSDPASISGAMVKLSAVAANTKWTLAGVSVVAIIFYAVRKAISRFTPKDPR